MGKKSHPSSLLLRFPGLAVERPYNNTKLKYMDGLNNGALVLSTWDSKGGRVRDITDEDIDETLLDMLQRRKVIPFSVRFECELHLARRCGRDDVTEKWPGFKPLLVDSSLTAAGLVDVLFRLYGNECIGDLHYFSKRRASSKA